MSRQQQFLLYAVFTLSGAAGLGYQFVWTRILALSLGHEFASLLGVITAFFLGLCAGSWATDHPRLRSINGLKLYAGAEAVIAASSMLAFYAEPFVSLLANTLLGETPGPLFQWGISFALPLLLLFPATAAMGLTFPAMERFISQILLHPQAVAGLYAANTAGAVLGVVVSAYLLMPTLGHSHTLFLFVLINTLCAGAGLMLSQHMVVPRAKVLSSLSSPLGMRAVTLLFMTGLLGIGLEIVAVRVLSQVFEGTIYSYAAVLAVYLLGTALGALIYRSSIRFFSLQRILADLLLGLAVATQLAVVTLDMARDAYHVIRLTLGDTLHAVVTSEAAIAALSLALPTLLMGALFSHLVQECRDRGASVGSAVATNTLGASFAAALLGIVVLPHVGVRGTLALLGLGYLALLLLSRWRPWLAVAAVAGFALMVPMQLQVITLRPGEWVVERREGILVSAAVVGKGAERNLRVNNRYQMGGTERAAMRLQSRQAHIPLLLHPHPRSALFLGIASGVTVGAAAKHLDIQLDAVELVPEVIALLPFFQPQNGAPQHNSRVRLINADARRFVRAAQSRYDVVVGDLFHPALDGAGALYTLEHFTAIRHLLAQDGLFCQWLPLYQLDEPTLRIIIATFLQVFPNAVAVLADENLEFPAIGLVSSTPSTDPRRSRMIPMQLAQHLADLHLREPVSQVGTFLAGTQALKSYAAGSAIGTDDYPRVIYLAPRFSAQRGTQSYGRLPGLLVSDPAEVKTVGGDERSERYVRSHNAALWGQIAEREGRLEEALDQYRTSAVLSEDYKAAIERIALLEKHTHH